MGASKKKKRRIIRNGREFFWCVKPDDDYMDLTHLFITSSDKRFVVRYQLFQSNPMFDFEDPFIVVIGREFKGLDHLGHRWERFAVPQWQDEVVTPHLVGQIIDWCFTVEDVRPVDCGGRMLAGRPLNTPAK